MADWPPSLLWLSLRATPRLASELLIKSDHFFCSRIKSKRLVSHPDLVCRGSDLELFRQSPECKRGCQAVSAPRQDPSSLSRVMGPKQSGLALLTSACSPAHGVDPHFMTRIFRTFIFIMNIRSSNCYPLKVSYKCQLILRTRLTRVIWNGNNFCLDELDKGEGVLNS